MEKKRSKGITIFSVTQIILGLVGLALSMRWTIMLFTMYHEEMNVNAGILPLFTLGYIISVIMFIVGVLTFVLEPIKKILRTVLLIPMPIFLIFIIYFFIFQYNDSNISTGFLVMFALMSFIISLPMFIAGVYTFFLKPIGRILSISYMVFLLPVSIFLIIYLLRTDVKEQFK